MQRNGSGLCNHDGRGFSRLAAAASHGVQQRAATGDFCHFYREINDPMRDSRKKTKKKKERKDQESKHKTISTASYARNASVKTGRIVLVFAPSKLSNLHVITLF